MADFCRQCWGPLFGDGEPGTDLAGLSTLEDTKNGLFACVLCEGCGFTQVDHRGNCVSWDCLEKHGVKPPLAVRLKIHVKNALRSPSFRRKLVLVAIVAAAVAALGGCAALQSDVEGWEPYPTYAALPTRYEAVQGHEIRARCGWAPASGRFTLHACAIRRWADNECVIITEAHPPAWIREHEEKHCAGYQHPRMGS